MGNAPGEPLPGRRRGSVMNQNLMIQVEHLTKKYAGRAAVNDISFTVGSGEVMVLLGPNGAGKSTTMRIIAGFISATSGTVRVAGMDVVEHSLEVRRQIGYMPENNPLYGEMRVIEYLRFRGRIKGLGGARLRDRIDAVMTQLEIRDVARKPIAHLSKGYRQRVGLADALLHEPALLILDEPTIGLDPQQVRAVRALIRKLGKQHTVLVSTHILSEAEMICDRVLIMHGGRLIAQGTPGELAHQLGAGNQVSVEITGNVDAFRKALACLPEVTGIESKELNDGFTEFRIMARQNADIRAQVYRLAVDTGCLLRKLAGHTISLEDIYVRATRPVEHDEEVEAVESRL